MASEWNFGAKEDPRSEWRRQSRRVIEAVLKDVPADAPEKAVREAVSAAYPFGRREHHPYKMWLVEVRHALRQRFPPRPSEQDSNPQVRFVLNHPVKPWWVNVACDWCQAWKRSRGETGGCMMCAAPERELRRLVDDPGWKDWLRDLDADPYAAPLVLADWLEEHDFPPALAELFRAEGKWTTEEAPPCPA
jgi:hypothetical protein